MLYCSFQLPLHASMHLLTMLNLGVGWGDDHERFWDTSRHQQTPDAQFHAESLQACVLFYIQITIAIGQHIVNIQSRFPPGSKN